MRYFPFIILFIFCSCSENNGKKDNSSKDSTTVTEVFAMDTVASIVNWDRLKKTSNTSSNLSIVKVKINMNIDKLDLTTKGSFAVKSGSWSVVNHKSVTGIVLIDLSKVSALKVDKNNKLEIGSPDYLNIDKFPTAKLEFTNVQSKCDSCNVSAKLTIKDTTGNIDFTAKIKWVNNIPQDFKAKFSIDGKKWGLVNKTASGNIEMDKLTFDCSFISSTKATSVMRTTTKKE